jgi:chaperone modulatory protein CbpM
MADEASPRIVSEVVEHTAVYTLHELCISCSVNPDWVAELVEQGAVEVVGRARQDWQFTTLGVLRVAKAKRLERDLGLNLPGIALALDLLDQIDEMRAQMRSVREHAVRSTE